MRCSVQNRVTETSGFNPWSNSKEKNLYHRFTRSWIPQFCILFAQPKWKFLKYEQHILRRKRFLSFNIIINSSQEIVLTETTSVSEVALCCPVIFKVSSIWTIILWLDLLEGTLTPVFTAVYPSFFHTIWVFIMRISHFIIPVGYGYLTVFLFSIHLGQYTMQKNFIPRQNGPSINMVYKGIEPNNN